MPGDELPEPTHAGAGTTEHALRAHVTRGGGEPSMDMEPLERAIEPIASSLKGA